MNADKLVEPGVSQSLTPRSFSSRNRFPPPRRRISAPNAVRPLCRAHVFAATAAFRWDRRNGENSAGRECFSLPAFEQIHVVLSPAARMMVVLASAAAFHLPHLLERVNGLLKALIRGLL